MPSFRVLLAFAVLFAPTVAVAQSGDGGRGSYLVNGLMACGSCHTPKGPQGDIAEKAFSGGLTFDEGPFKVTASNITPDPETGIGSWSADDLKRLLRTGVRPNGVPLAPIMPTGFYGLMSEEDLDQAVAYLRSVPAVKNKVPDPVYRAVIPRQVFPGAEKPYTATDIQAPVARGFYLATLAHCMECHTPMGPRGRDFANDLGKGGFELKGPWGISISRNITQSTTKGLGGWTDAEIKRAITKGISKDGSHLAPPMSFASYERASEADLDAIVAWLRTLPARD
ncbi:c-type cytochrome [uncultured Alsobacter sp.]|uniref:c-type cytochrome n=1 Tax=uncultured Alsobacter sp. TaxID=1748258 RepID=UPI0025E0D98E|nr:c-type cytochrome [uncultured Alsobacter sp.]